MKLNKVCNMEDWLTDGRAAAMQRMLPYFLQASADYPAGMEHRKHWEFAQIVLGLDKLDVLIETPWFWLSLRGRGPDFRAH